SLIAPFVSSTVIFMPKTKGPRTAGSGPCFAGLHAMAYASELIVDDAADDVTVNFLGRADASRGNEVRIHPGHAGVAEIVVKDIHAENPARCKKIIDPTAGGPTDPSLRVRSGNSVAECVDETDRALHVTVRKTAGTIEQPVIECQSGPHAR